MLGIKTIIFELGLFRTKVMHPDNVKAWRSDPIADYDGLRAMVGQFVQGINGNQAGDPKKAVKVMIDVVKGEGVAEGKAFPERLPLGSDAFDTVKKARLGHLAVCDEWEDVIKSTGYDA
jgi:hypothetical protein